MDRVLVLSADPLLRSQAITLTPKDGFVLSRVDGTLSARAIVDLIPLPAEDTERSLLSLLCTGIVSYSEEVPAEHRADEAAAWFASRTGVNLRALRPCLRAIADAVEALGRKRRLPSGVAHQYSWDAATSAPAKTLREMSDGGAADG